MRRVSSIYHHSSQMLIQESEWIDLAKEDPKHFAPLYEKYYQQIFRYVNQRMRDEHSAHDITSQVFYKAIQNIEKFEFRGIPLGSWLYRIAKSELNQAFRDKRAKREINIEHVHLSTFMEVFKDETLSRDKKRLFHVLSQLNGLDLQLIELRYFESRSYREIGELLDVKENNAKVKTFRALEKLRKLFGAKEGLWRE